MRRLRALLLAAPVALSHLVSPSLARAQLARDSVFRTVVPSTIIRCVSLPATDSALPRGTVSAFAYSVGLSEFQVRDGAGHLQMMGPPPRWIRVAFDAVGHPVEVIDSVFRPWRRGAGVAQFDSLAHSSGYQQAALIDSARVMEIAMRLGPKRLQEAVAEAAKLETLGPRTPLDTLNIQAARAIASVLWGQRCGRSGAS